MTDLAAIDAEFVDFKLIKGRKVVVICLEIPLEKADRALAVLGGIPNPAESRYVAVARLETQPAKVEKPKGPTPSQRAWALCQSGRFQSWLFRNTPSDNAYDMAPSAEETASALRYRLGVKSRGELDTNPEARARFETLEREYQEAHR
jgi:hypothetical protein